MKKKLGPFLFAMFAFCFVNAQTQVYELPVYFGQFFNDPQINGIGLYDGQEIGLTMGHRRNSNNFGGVNTSLFSGRFKLKSKNDEAFHSLGVNFTNDKEGFLLRRNRFSMSYARHLKISNQFNLAGGFSAGFYNFSVVSNDAIGGLSSYAFDGSFSLSLYNKTTRVGLDVNQFTNSSIQPLDQEIILARHLNLLVSHRFNLIEEDLKFTPTIIGRYSKSGKSVFSGLGLTLGGQFLFKDKFMAGLSQEKSNGMYFFLGIIDINMGSSLLDIDFSYFIPNQGNLRSNVQLFEIFVSYDINLNKKKD